MVIAVLGKLPVVMSTILFYVVNGHALHPRRIRIDVKKEKL